MAALNLTAYNYHAQRIHKKAKLQAEDFIAHWNAAGCSQGDYITAESKLCPDVTPGLEQEIHDAITLMMYSSGFITKYDYKKKKDGVHFRVQVTIMTPEEKAVLIGIEERAMSAMD